MAATGQGRLTALHPLPFFPERPSSPALVCPLPTERGEARATPDAKRAPLPAHWERGWGEGKCTGRAAQVRVVTASGALMTTDETTHQPSIASGPRSTGVRTGRSKPWPSWSGGPAGSELRQRPRSTSRSISLNPVSMSRSGISTSRSRRCPNAGDSGMPFPGRPNVAGVRKGLGGGRS
jgi:hypothetical protein